MTAFAQESPLACQGLGYRAQGRWLLHDVTLAVRPGEKLGIVGPNGSGKSTLLRLLAGLRHPDNGEVRLQGVPLSRMKRRDIARSIALVEQLADTDDAILVREAVQLGRTPWLSAWTPWDAEQDRIVEQALAAVGLQDFAERAWHGLSGGERQRVHIARALAQCPSLLLLDEPTNHLDVQQQLALLELIRSLPLTCVIALHDLNQALCCDRLAVLEGGRLVALGTPAEVLSADCLARTFGVEGRWLTDPFDGGPVLRLRRLAR
jgi:iron complex transport system ATP-binding protein